MSASSTPSTAFSSTTATDPALARFKNDFMHSSRLPGHFAWSVLGNCRSPSNTCSRSWRPKQRPPRQLPPAPGRALTLALTALVALALDRALAAYADTVGWSRATPNEWITTAALSFIGAGIILHVGIGLRWPFATRPCRRTHDFPTTVRLRRAQARCRHQ